MSETIAFTENLRTAALGLHAPHPAVEALPAAADLIEDMFEALECIQRDIRTGEMNDPDCRIAHAQSIDTLLRPIRGESA